MRVKRMMLLGRTGSGKTFLIQALRGEELSHGKTLAVAYGGAFEDTPGEYIENRRLHPAPMATSSKCDVVALVQDASMANRIYPPQCAGMFNRKVIGIVAKVDCGDARIQRAETFLRWAGVEEISHAAQWKRSDWRPSAHTWRRRLRAWNKTVCFQTIQRGA